MGDQSTDEWTGAVEIELGLEPAVDSNQGLDALDELVARVSGTIGATAAGRTAFLAGVAAGRAEEPAIAAQDIAQKLSALAEGWDSDAERGVPSHDQSRRAQP